MSLPPKKMQQDGFYVVDTVSTKGATRNVYHFVDDKHVRQLFKVKSTNEELISWYSLEPNSESMVNYLPPSRNKIHTYFNRNGFQGDGSIDLDSSGMVKNSTFYQIIDGKIVAQKSALPSSKKYNYQVFTNEAKPVITGEYTEVKEVAQGYYLLESNDVSTIVNTEGNRVSDSYAWIGSKILKSKHFMAYDGQHFCVISHTGEIEIPCIYPDMMEMKGGLYVVSDGEQQSLIDVNGEVLFESKDGEIITSFQPTKNIITIRKKDEKLTSFWSNVTKDYLDIQASKYFSVPGSNNLWTVKTSKGLLILDEAGEVKIKSYLKSSVVHDDYLIVRDKANYSMIFNLDGEPNSNAFLGEIVPSYSDIHDGKDSLFNFKSETGASGLINTTGKMVLSGQIKRMSYAGNGVYILKNGYKGPAFLFSEKTGLINLGAKDISKYRDSIFTIVTDDNLYGLWDLDTQSWLKESEKYAYISKGRDTNYSYYMLTGSKRYQGFMGANGEELTQADFKGKMSVRFNKGVNINSGNVTVFELPSGTKILELEGKSAYISDYGSIFVFKPL